MGLIPAPLLPWSLSLLALYMPYCRRLVIKPEKLQRGDLRDAETEGFFTYRIADRGGDHFDHRCHRDPELAARSYSGERVLCGLVHPYRQHSRSQLYLGLSDRGL